MVLNFALSFFMSALISVNRAGISYCCFSFEFVNLNLKCGSGDFECRGICEPWPSCAAVLVLGPAGPSTNGCLRWQRELFPHTDNKVTLTEHDDVQMCSAATVLSGPMFHVKQLRPNNALELGAAGVTSHLSLRQPV
jgi:hypothetical protein